jgi:hypothetical protein
VSPLSLTILSLGSLMMSDFDRFGRDAATAFNAPSLMVDIGVT